MVDDGGVSEGLVFVAFEDDWRGYGRKVEGGKCVRFGAGAELDVGTRVGQVGVDEADVLCGFAFEAEEDIGVVRAGGVFDGYVLAVFYGNDGVGVGFYVYVDEFDVFCVFAGEAFIGGDGEIFEGDVFDGLFGQAYDFDGFFRVLAGDIFYVNVAEERRFFGERLEGI